MCLVCVALVGGIGFGTLQQTFSFSERKLSVSRESVTAELG